MADPTPAERVRRNLEGRDGRRAVTLAELLGAFALPLDASADERRSVTEALAREGVDIRPAIADVSDPEAPLLLRIEDPELLARKARAAEIVRQAETRTPAAGDRDYSAPESARRRGPSDRLRDIPPEPGDPRPEKPARRRPERDADELEPQLPPVLLGLGAVVLVISMFLPWFQADQAGVEIEDLSTAWDWFEFLDIYLLFVGVAAVALLVLSRAFADLLLSRAVAVVTAVALFLVAYRIASPPDSPPDDVGGIQSVIEVSLRPGPFVALLGVAAILAGALMPELLDRSESSDSAESSDADA